MDTKAYRDWLMLVDMQQGIVGRRQALELGFTEGHIRHRLAAGQWQRVHPGVYATFTGHIERGARLWAAICLAGKGAMLSHESAAEVQGLMDKATGFTIHITVPSKRRAVDGKPVRGIVIHRSDERQPEFPFGSWKIPRTRVEDTVLDLVASAPTFERGYAWVARAVSRRLTTVAMLRAALAGRSRYRWRAWLTDALQDSGDGLDSSLERCYVRDVERAHGLPIAKRQASRTINGRTHRRDNWYADYHVIVEIDGPTYHQGDRAEADKDRDNLNLAADATQTFRFGPVALTERACQSAALVAAALRRNGWPAHPHACPRPNCPIRPFLDEWAHGSAAPGRRPCPLPCPCRPRATQMSVLTRDTGVSDRVRVSGWSHPLVPGYGSARPSRLSRSVAGTYVKGSEKCGGGVRLER